jgi:predicted nucleotide-binding protein (sugar kinase/HSP70/actin superfamily)
MPVGVPRSLSFFYLFPLYRAFLNELGVEWVESPFTSETDLHHLDLCPTDEPCIAVKAAFVHVDHLLRKGCDKLFMPAVVSLSRTAYCCPKMMGLPAMLKAAFGVPDDAFVSPVIDMRDDPKGWSKTWIKAARMLGVTREDLARRALAKGMQAWRDHEAKCVHTGQTTGTGVMGHSYILHDIFGRRLVEEVGRYGPVVTAENVSEEDAVSALQGIFESEKLWTIEGHILGAALHLIRTRKANRLIFVSAFSCGPASIIENYVAKEADARGIPLLNLAIDEHSGEAGLLTRLEAFMDSTRVPARTLVSRGAGKTGEAPQGPEAPEASKVPEAPRMLPVPESRNLGPIGLVDMGNLRYALRSLFAEMDCDMVMPPPLTEDIVRLGKEIAPEFICYPMVTLIGQMRKHAENGVRKIIMVQGKGRCRLGWYAQIMEEILRKSGYPVRVLSVDSPLPLSRRWRPFVESYRALSEGAPFTKGLHGFRMALTKIGTSDRADDILRDIRAYEAERGEGDRRYARFLRELDEAVTPGEVKAVFNDYCRDMERVPRLKVNPLRVTIVGEVYVVNEPFVNKHAEKMLGSLEQRVRVYRTLDVTSWVDYHLFKLPTAVRQYAKVVRSAAPYLPVNVGGHGQESVGETVLAKAHGMDGVIHLFPFTCMPEIIAQNILVKVSRDLDIPVLSLMISEQTGVAGLETRFEAFCDLLEGRRRQDSVSER